VSRILKIALLAATFAALALPAPAVADYRQVIRDCAQDGKLDGHYSNSELRQARDNLPTDIKEYTDCYGVISAAMTNGGGGTSTGGGPHGAGGSGGGGGGASTPAGATGTHAGVAALNRDTKALSKQKPSISLGGEAITPVAHGLDRVPGAANNLPLSLLLAIVAVAALCAAGGAAAARRHLPALVRAPLRLIRR
jgi:hypothetical protein